MAAKHNRTAMSLQAAFRALNDTNYLNEAATNFPNNPQVELAVLTQDEMVDYAERVKIYGETAAKQWVIQQHPPNPLQNGQQ